MRLAIRSTWNVEHWRGDYLLDRSITHNMITDQGIAKALDVLFGTASRISIWYIGLFSDDYTATGAETYAAKGCTEYTGYAETARKIWTPGTITAGAISNSASKAVFTISTPATVYGGFLVGGGTLPSTKGNSTTGSTLYCIDQFSSAMVGAAGDILRVAVSIGLVDA